jgi:hypothetical protein
MAHPADPAVKAPATFANARLTPEEADRLAALFRPSWEYDDAPFTGAGSLSPSEIQALQGGGVRADVRAATAMATAHPVTNGTHAAAPGHEPENSVVIDRSITAADLPPKPGGKTIMGGLQAPVAPPPQSAPPAPEPALHRPPTPKAIQRPAAPDFRVGPPVARSPASIRQAIQIDEPVAYPRKSRKGLFIGAGAAAALLVVVGIFVAASGGDKPTGSAATTAAAEKPTEDKLAAVPPPPAATTTADPTPAAPPVPTTAAPAPPPAPVQPPVAPVTALPVAPPQPPPQPHYAAAPPPPRPAPAAAPPRPKKGGQTIVRDVPF